MLISFIILMVIVPLLVLSGLRFHMSLYKRGAFPSKVSIALPISWSDEIISIEDDDEYE